MKGVAKDSQGVKITCGKSIGSVSAVSGCIGSSTPCRSSDLDTNFFLEARIRTISKKNVENHVLRKVSLLRMERFQQVTILRTCRGIDLT